MATRQGSARAAVGGVLGLCAAVGLGQAQGAAIEVPQKSTKEMGLAFAGSSALVEDASAVANNPAGLMRLSGHNIAGGLTLLRPNFRYDVAAATELAPGEPFAASRGATDTLAVAPHLYYSRRLSANSAWGLGIYAPFASSTEYPDGWAGRYHAVETNITVVNLNPVFAVQATPNLALGAGIIVQYFSGEYTSYIDAGYLVADQMVDRFDTYGGLLADTVQAARPYLRPMLGNGGVDWLAEAAAGLQLSEADQARLVQEMQGQHDVYNDMEVDGLGYGFNLGLLWEPTSSTRVGLNYFSTIRHRAEGEARRPQTLDPAYQEQVRAAIAQQVSTQLVNGVGIPASWVATDMVQGLVDVAVANDGAATVVDARGAAGGDLELQLDMPEIATLGIYQGLSPRLAITGSATFTRWSRLQEFRFSYPDDGDRGGGLTGSDLRRRDLVQPLGFRDTWRYGIGLIFRASDALTLRTGVSYDESPVRNFTRGPRGPDADRTILGLGASLRWSPRLGFDAAYTYTHFDRSPVDNRENPAGTHHRLYGDYEVDLHSVSVQANYRF